MSIRIYQMRDHSISVDQARYATSIVAKYLDTATIKTSLKKLFYLMLMTVYIGILLKLFENGLWIL